jgi:hypothetical protein
VSAHHGAAAGLDERTARGVIIAARSLTYWWTKAMPFRSRGSGYAQFVWLAWFSDAGRPVERPDVVVRRRTMRCG